MNAHLRDREDFVQILRRELGWLRARHDPGAMFNEAYVVIVKDLETDISWAEHWNSLGDVADGIVKKLEVES